MILRADGLRKLYGEFCALDGVSLTVGPGEFVSIIGPNGAGKSTLINILTGVTRPTTGSVLFKDREVQAGALEVAELFGLAERRHVPARQLPQGDKKLLDVASAFALRPEIILLDEPTSGVSTADKTAIMETLVAASKRIGLRAIIQVEHDMDIVFAYSDRIIALHQGKVLADAAPAAILSDQRVIDTVLGRRAVRG